MKRFTILVMLLSSLTLRLDGAGQVSSRPMVEKDRTFNVEAKRKEVVALVNKGAEYFGGHTVAQSAQAFRWHSDFVQGDIRLFLIDLEGTCLMYGNNNDIIWNNLRNTKNNEWRRMFSGLTGAVSDAAAGWATYDWSGASCLAYVTAVKKGDKTYLLGAPLFPHSKKYDAMNLVKQAVDYITTHGTKDALRRISNRLGAFVRGDLYVFVYDEHGECVAHGDDIAMIGQNRLHMKDSRGYPIIQNMIKIAHSKEGRGWITYELKGAEKKSYVERVVDPHTKRMYVVGCGYWPSESRQDLTRLVNKMTEYVFVHGAKKAFNDFTQVGSNFVRGHLNIFAYTVDGTCVADSLYPVLVGQQISNRQDENGQYFVKKILEIAKEQGSGWVTYRLLNAYRVVYFQLFDGPEGRFVLGAGFYPSTKHDVTQLLVEQGKNALISGEMVQVMNALSSPGSRFSVGNLNLFLYDMHGYCFVQGHELDHVWRNVHKQAVGTSMGLAKQLIVQIQKGVEGWFDYPADGTTYRVYAEKVERAVGDVTQTFVIGSGYYL